MKRYLLVILMIGSFLTSRAMHITGGEIIYQYMGPGAVAGTKQYSVTLLLFRDDIGGGAALPGSVVIAVYNNSTRQLLPYQNVDRASVQQVPINPFPPCITNEPRLVYSVGYYTFIIDLPDNTLGYTIGYQTCCRVDGIDNVPNRTGATYTSVIPGSINAPLGDNSPRFAQGISVVCFNKPFTLDFSAVDSNSDSLVYSFCSAYDGGGANTHRQPANYPTPEGPPYDNVNYLFAYNGSSPMGSTVSINSNTGIISGIAPGAGKYVVSVCINAYDRTTKLFKATHRKDFIVTVAPCDLAGAQLNPTYLSCDGFTFTFSNLNTSPLNESFFWDFGDGNISTDATPTHTYAVAGDYDIKLVVNRGDPCADSARAKLKVYPGFFPGFNNINPACAKVPLQFTDITTANYGTVNSWKWDFGITDAINDTSRLRNPTFVYPQAGSYTASLTVGSSVGCEKTITTLVEILDHAPYTLTKDTLICSIDTLRLNFTTANPGTITWSPNYMISNTNVFNPLVSPDVTTTYRFNYRDNFGCTATDTIRVRVVDRVTLNAMPDTTICLTDPVKLSVISDGLQYTWTPAATLDNPALQSPVATPTDTTAYHLIARIGKCFARDTITVSTVPYPLANAGADNEICFGSSVQLNASGGSIYSWSPRLFLNNSNIPNPVSQAPQQSMQYVVTVRDVLGCPKPVNDTMQLIVTRIIADAGPADTNVVLGQPLLLNATGSTNYEWTPATWLSNPTIFNPVSLPQESIKYIVRVSNDIGCFDTDTINVKLFKIDPDLLVPTGFSPDGDGNNDIFRPIVIGMRSLDVFKVYNRWGQLLYSTNKVNNGWDGSFKGAPQSAGTYVWMAEGITYLGRKVKKKGTVILIR
ncbi:MAG: PKD domain-containing protein [Sphingobacteriales bacterium]|nr:MAG: PKD domain-containing protein [Sphingobacteriales bacterium]